MSNGIKLEVGKLYITRSGLKVRVLATDLNRGSYSVAAVVTVEDTDYVASFTKDGCCSGPTYNWDIVGPWVEPPRKKIVYEWLVRRDSSNWYISGNLLTEEEARKEFKWFTEWRKTGRQFEVEE
jgi:hypothetical protein